MDAIMMMEASELIFERCLKKSANANPHLALPALINASAGYNREVCGVQPTGARRNTGQQL